MVRRKHRQTLSVASDVEIALSGIAYGGEAIGRHEGQVVFVAGGIPGERAKVDLFQERKGMLRGVIRSVAEASPDRVVPPCPYFGFCGGCQWQHIAYQRQLELKTRVVREQLQRIGAFPEPPVRGALGSPREWAYRNHVRFSAGRHGHLGFRRPHTHRFLAIDRCLISHALINELLADVQGRGAGQHQVVMRVGEHTGQVLLYPGILLADSGGSGAVRGNGLLHDELQDELLGRRFWIDRSSFFQVNTLQAERMARLVLDALALTGTEVVVDAYCGVGTFALLMAPFAREVIGIEESRSAIKNAERNREGVDNVRFIAAKTEQVLPALDCEVDAVVIDPARTGCAPEVVEALIRLRAGKLAYVSCDPATLARDLRMLATGGYQLEAVQPVDMFPQTYHVENVAFLRWVQDG